MVFHLNPKRRESMVMTRIGALLTAALMVLGSGFCRAEEEADTPAPAPPQPPVAASSPCPCPAACPVPRHRVWDWLCYRPLTRSGCCRCGYGCTPCCTPPLYTFFLQDCHGGAWGTAPAEAGCSGKGPRLRCRHSRPCVEAPCPPAGSH